MSWRMRVFVFVIGLHVLAILGLFVQTLIQRLIHPPKKKYEVVTTVQLNAPPSPLPPEQFETPRAPEPPPSLPEPPPPPPKPEPPPKPKPKLKTPDQVKVSKKKIKKESTPEPKPAPRPDPKPTPPKKLTPEELEKIMQGIKPKPGPQRESVPAAAPSSGELDTLYALIREKMYTAWRQPGGISSSAGFVTEVSIRIHRSGAISGHRIVKPSGHTAMDQSALAGARSVTRVTAIPTDFPAYQDVTVEFLISD